MDNIRVLIVDDHPLARRGIITLLSVDTAFHVVGEAENGEEALSLARSLDPDLILMDINMPKCDGLLATRQIRARVPRAKVVMVTVSDDVQDLFEAIKNGAQGYLLKNLSPGVWTEYLRAVARGETPISKQIASDILREFSNKVADDRNTSPDDLTGRERDVLGWVAQGSTNKEIARALSITENTVKNHLKNILSKLHLRNRVQLATYAVRSGIASQSQVDYDKLPEDGRV